MNHNLFEKLKSIFHTYLKIKSFPNHKNSKFVEYFHVIFFYYFAYKASIFPEISLKIIASRDV